MPNKPRDVSCLDSHKALHDNVPMGLITTQIELRNPLDSRLAPLTTMALVDTGAMHLCLPQHVVLQLDLQAVQQREVTTADGQRHVCDYVGPVEVTFGNLDHALSEHL